MYTYTARILNVIDADTVEADIDLGFRTWRRDRIRLLGVNAPEKTGPEAKAGEAATMWLLEQLGDLPATVIMRTDRDRAGKFGRYLALVFLELGAVARGPRASLNCQLIREGYARAAWYGSPPLW